MVLVQLARDLIQERRKCLCRLRPHRGFDELSLPASAVWRHDHSSRGDVREALAVVPADQVKAQVEAGGRAGARQHRPVADVKHIWIDPGERESVRQIGRVPPMRRTVPAVEQPGGT